MKIRRYLECEDTLKGTIVKFYGLIIGQCTLALHSMIRGNKDFESNSKAFNALWFLKMIKKITVGMDTKANPYLMFHDQLITFMMTRQGMTKSHDEYLNQFNAHYKNMEISGGENSDISPQLLNEEIENAMAEEVEGSKKLF